MYIRDQSSDGTAVATTRERNDHGQEHQAAHQEDRAEARRAKAHAGGAQGAEAAGLARHARQRAPRALRGARRHTKAG